MEQYIPLILTASKYMLIPLSLLILLRCIRSMLSSGVPSFETAKSAKRS